MKRITSIIIFILFLSTAHCYPQDNEKFIYKNKGKRNPFAPLVTKEGKVIVTYGAVNSINDIVLNGIIYDPSGKSVVLLNDFTLGEGESIGSIRVKKIGKDNVILQTEDNEYVLKLKE